MPDPLRSEQTILNRSQVFLAQDFVMTKLGSLHKYSPSPSYREHILSKERALDYLVCNLRTIYRDYYNLALTKQGENTAISRKELTLISLSDKFWHYEPIVLSAITKQRVELIKQRINQCVTEVLWILSRLHHTGIIVTKEMIEETAIAHNINTKRKIEGKEKSEFEIELENMVSFYFNLLKKLDLTPPIHTESALITCSSHDSINSTMTSPQTISFQPSSSTDDLQAISPSQHIFGSSLVRDLSSGAASIVFDEGSSSNSETQKNREFLKAKLLQTTSTSEKNDLIYLLNSLISTSLDGLVDKEPYDILDASDTGSSSSTQLSSTTSSNNSAPMTPAIPDHFKQILPSLSKREYERLTLLTLEDVIGYLAKNLVELYGCLETYDRHETSPFQNDGILLTEDKLNSYLLSFLSCSDFTNPTSLQVRRTDQSMPSTSSDANISVPVDISPDEQVAKLQSIFIEIVWAHLVIKNTFAITPYHNDDFKEHLDACLRAACLAQIFSRSEITEQLSDLQIKLKSTIEAKAQETKDSFFPGLYSAFETTYSGEIARLKKEIEKIKQNNKLNAKLRSNLLQNFYATSIVNSENLRRYISLFTSATKSRYLSVLFNFLTGAKAYDTTREYESTPLWHRQYLVCFPTNAAYQQKEGVEIRENISRTMHTATPVEQICEAIKQMKKDTIESRPTPSAIRSTSCTQITTGQTLYGQRQRTGSQLTPVTRRHQENSDLSRSLPSHTPLLSRSPTAPLPSQVDSPERTSLASPPNTAPASSSPTSPVRISVGTPTTQSKRNKAQSMAGVIRR